MAIAVRGKVLECHQPRSKELCRGVLPQCGGIISLRGCQVSNGPPIPREVAGASHLGHGRSRLREASALARANLASRTGDRSCQKLGCKSPRVSGSARVAYQVNRNMGASRCDAAAQNARPAPGDFSSGHRPRAYYY